MPSAAGENVPAASSDSTRESPAARSRSPVSRLPSSCPSTPTHSMPACFTPKSSFARSVKRTVSVSSSTDRPARPSDVIVGGASSRACSPTTSGLPAESPSVSCHSSVISRSRSTSTAAVAKLAPSGTTSSPSARATERSRLAVAATVTVLPFTTDTTPPRASFTMVSGRSRYSGSWTLASIPAISGRKVGARVTFCRASPTDSDSDASAAWGGSMKR